MPGLHLDSGQRYTCQACGRCCRRGWEIAITPREAEHYRKANAGRWFREREDLPEGAARDPFEPIPGHAPFIRIRRRPDGACGFLGLDNLCRIHQELGGPQKPLTCRLFPYRFHAVERETVVTTSFSCPTVVAGRGEPIASNQREIASLSREWFQVYPETPRPVRYAGRQVLAPRSVDTIRRVLRRMLDRPGTGGEIDLAANVTRMADWLEDLSRWRVLRLAPERFAEYLELTGAFAARSDKPVRVRRPGRVARLLARGFLFLVVAAREHLAEGAYFGPRLRLRLRLARLFAHFHGIAPGTTRVSLPAARRVRIDLSDPETRAILYNALRAGIETVGTGRWPVLTEMGIQAALLNGALAAGAMRAGLAGRDRMEGQDLTEGLIDASDLTHADTAGPFGRVLAGLAPDEGPLRVLASGRPV